MSGSPSARQRTLSGNGGFPVCRSTRTSSHSASRKLNSRVRKNWTPETQCLALFQKNFVLLTSRLILRFPHFFTFVGGWGNSFPLFKVRNFYHFINQLVRKVENFLGISRLSLIMFKCLNKTGRRHIVLCHQAEIYCKNHTTAKLSEVTGLRGVKNMSALLPKSWTVLLRNG